MSATATVRSAESAPPIDVVCIAHLDALLDQLAEATSRSRPIVAHVTVRSSELLIGLGAAESLVQLSAASGEGRYLVTLGDRTASGVATFWLHGQHHTEVPRRYLIPNAAAQSIVREFCSTGRRLDTVNWVEVGE